MYQYILFDLDGTLTDPKIGICTSVQYALADAGIEEKNLDVLEPFIGPPLKDSFMEFYHMNEQEAERAISKYRERFEVTGLYENEVYEGIPQMLQSLQKAGIELGIASSKPTVFVEKILAHFRIKEYFDVIVGSELDGSRGKKEEVVEEALRQLVKSGKEDYDRCVMIGDRRFDVEGAQEHGIDSIGVAYGYGGRKELRKAGATYIVDTVKELQQLLLHTGKGEKYTIKSSFNRAREILSPLLCFWIICNVVMVAGVAVLQGYLSIKGLSVGELEADFTGRFSVYLNALSVIAAIPIIYVIYMKKSMNQGKEQWYSSIRKLTVCGYLLTIIIGVSSAIFLNMVLSYIDFGSLSLKYHEVSARQYSVSIPMGILVYGIVTPIAEEMVFRGIIWKRINRYFPSIMGIVLSAFIFGMYHGNLVQGVYGFLLGLLIAVCYSWFDTLLVPILFHGAANISIFMISQNPDIEHAINKPLNCVIFMIISILTFVQLQKMKNRK